MPLPLFRFAVICLRCCRGGSQIRPLFFGRVSFHAKGFALRGDLLCPRRRRRQNAAGGVPRSPHGSSGATPGPRLRGLPLHPSAEVPASRGRGCRIGGAPDGAVSINKGRADLGSAPTAASENYKKENNGRGEPLPYGVSGKRKQNRGGTGKQKGRSPRTSRGFVLFILIARVCALLSPAHTPAGRPAPPWTWGE